MSVRRETLHVATAVKQKGINMAGWTVVPDVSFWYTDKGKTRMSEWTAGHVRRFLSLALAATGCR